jgi:hypothetical protein
MFGVVPGLVEVRAQEAAMVALCAALDPDSVPPPEAPEIRACFALPSRRRSGLPSCPRVEEAVTRGELSPAQTSAITEAATAAPGAEARLIELAGRRSLGELRDECARTKAAADADAEARHRRVHQSRSCRRRTTFDGAGEIVYRSTLDEIAEVWSVISGYARLEFRRARAEGRREPPDAYAADAMLAMARAARAGTTQADDGATTASGPAAAPRASWPHPRRRRRRGRWPTGSSCASTGTPSSVAGPPTARCVRSPGWALCRCHWYEKWPPRVTPSSLPS